MPDITGTKISALDADSNLNDSDYLAGVDANASPIKTKKFTLSALKAFIVSSLSKSDVGLENVDNVQQYSSSNKPSAADVTYDHTVSGLSATDVKGALDELAQGGGGGASVDGGTLTLSLSWSGSGPYTQTVTVTGAAVTANSLISLQPTAAQLAQLISDGVTAITIENNAGTLTAYALGAMPSTAMTLACTVMEVAS